MNMFLDLNKTSFLRASEIKEKWYFVNAESLKLGELASEISKFLRGKYSPFFTRHMNMKIKIIVINTDKLYLSEKKWKEKTYYSHTQRLGGQSVRTAQQIADRHGTEKVLRTAVLRMTKNNKLRDEIMRNLYIYSGAEHLHSAQKPEELHLRINKVKEENVYSPVDINNFKKINSI